ncbi:DUF5677 domain-containing protein [Pseudomonas lurida]|uniref:DUF5677 domain-containing protein n=1 Tax=Pseudomonas lurida TaxID=244566 RepID=UPI0016493687|nr:DUF5677 domain-containing protein [Pseudomonas lurida]MBC3233855.1 hypothetical protein [Pseudomonas lurida]
MTLKKSSADADTVLQREAENLKQRLEGRLEETLSGDHSDFSGFRERLSVTWGKPLGRLRSLTLMCQEILSELIEEQRNGQLPSDVKFNVLTRLFSRSVQLSGEIHNSLSGGYSEGGFSRWRAMHETCVVLSLLGNADNSLSVRFKDFQSVLGLRAAEFFNAHSKVTGEPPISAEVMTELQEAFDRAIQEHGSDFDRENGWAKVLLPDTKKITFSKLEELSGYQSLRPQYKLASQYVHTGADSLDNNMGLYLSRKNILLTGPSNEGLAQPLMFCGLSLVGSLSVIANEYPQNQRDLFQATAWKWLESLYRETLEALDDLAATGPAAQNGEPEGD